MDALIRMAALLGLAAGLAVPALSDERPSYVRIGTGSILGTYYPVGQALAEVLSRPVGSPPCDRNDHCGVVGLIAVAEASDGSVANVEAVESGEFETALSQSTVVDAAYFGARQFEGRGRAENLRIIANLYPESVHLVVARKSGIHKIADLKGKRISIDRTTSGTASDATMILKAFGLTHKSLKLTEESPLKAADLVAEGKLDGFFYITGYPSPLITDLAERTDIDIIPIAGTQAQSLVTQSRFFSPGRIPAGTYKGIADVETVQMGAQFIANARVSADLIYAVTKTLWDPANLKALARRHPQAAMIRLDQALQGITIPLHPGAERFYREIGLLKDGPLAAAPTDRSRPQRP